MRKSLADIEHLAQQVLQHRKLNVSAASRCAWLHGAGYNGLKYLAEALDDDTKTLALALDALGLDLKSISCVFISDDVERIRAAQARVFLRNVRHGLYLLPNSVIENYGIGCPVDPGFALGGERTKNPYVEKLEVATRDGVEVDDVLWHSLQSVVSGV
jgi:hypothetical protein